MARSRREELQVGVLLAVAFAVLTWIALKIGALTAWQDTVDVELRLADAAGLQAGAVVAVAGVQVGTVSSLRVEHDRAVAGLALHEGAGLRRDVVLRVRARSLLGEKYLQAEPGGQEAPLLVDGDVLEATGDQVEVDEVLSALAPMLRAVDPEALGRAVGAVADAIEADPERVARMLVDAERILARGAEAAEDLPAMVAEGRATLAKVDGAVDAAQARLTEVKSPVARADRLLAEAEAAGVGATVSEARGALEEVRGVAKQASDLIGGLDGLDRDLKKVLANFAEIDKWELRRLLREEGILIRVKERSVVPVDREVR